MSFLARSIPETTFTLRIRDSSCWRYGEKNRSLKNGPSVDHFRQVLRYRTNQFKEASLPHTEVQEATFWLKILKALEI